MAGGSFLSGFLLTWHWIAGAREARERYALSGREGFRLYQARTSRLPGAGQKGQTTYGFPSSLNSCLSLYRTARRKSENGNRSEKRNGSRVTAAFVSQNVRSSQIAYCYTDRLLSASATQGELSEGQERVPWGITVSRNSFTRYYRQFLRITTY